MKYKDLIEQYRSDPCDDNADVVKSWLEKRHKSTHSVREALFTLIEQKPELSTFEWVECWLESRDWFPLQSLVHIQSAAWHERLIHYASVHPQNPHIASLWKEFLFGCKYESLVGAASDWLVKFGYGDDAIIVAELLLPMTDDPALQQKAVALIQASPTEFNVPSLIKHIGDAETIKLAREILSATASDTGMLIAAALLEFDSAKNWFVVQEWIRSRWNEKCMQFALGYLMDVAPILVAPLALQWVEEHPRAKNVSGIFATGFSLKPSPELFELHWKWLETRTDKKYSPELLSVLFNHWNRFKTPPGALKFADEWLKDNEANPYYVSILIGVIGEEATEFRIEMACRWLASREDKTKGHMLMNLRRRSPSSFTDEALDWAYRNPSETESQVIKYEYFRDTQNDRGVTVEEVEEFVSVYLFPKERLCGKIQAKDKDAIAWAKALLKAPQIEGKHSESARCRHAPLLAALYQAEPTDTEVLAEIERWFDSSEYVCEEHLKQMCEAVGES